MRWVAGVCFEDEFLEKKIYKKVCEERCKYMYTRDTTRRGQRTFDCYAILDTLCLQITYQPNEKLKEKIPFPLIYFSPSRQVMCVCVSVTTVCVYRGGLKWRICCKWVIPSLHIFHWNYCAIRYDFIDSWSSGSYHAFGIRHWLNQIPKLSNWSVKIPLIHYWYSYHCHQ